MHNSKTHSNQISNYFGAIVSNVIIIYILNHLLTWNVRFLTNGFSACLWLFNLSLSFTILANVLFLFYCEPWFKNLLNILINIVSFIALFTLYKLFPFNLTQIEKTFVLIFLIVAIVSTVIAALVNFFKLAFNLSDN